MFDSDGDLRSAKGGNVMENNLNKKLIMAVKVYYLEGVQRLLIEGADPNWKGEEEASALDWIDALPDDDDKDIVINIRRVIESSMASYKTVKEKQDKVQEEKSEFYKGWGKTT